MKSGRIVIAAGLVWLANLAMTFQLGYLIGERSAEQQRKSVFVAAEELRQGSVINDPERQFFSTQLPAGHVPQGAITDIGQFQGMQVLRTLDAGAICTQRHLGKFESRHRSMAGQLAIAIRVKFAQPILILPGSRIDVFAIVPNKDDPSRHNTNLIVSNLLVLANEGKEVDKKGMMLVTLAVMPAEAEKLMRFESEYTLTLWPCGLDESKK